MDPLSSSQTTPQGVPPVTPDQFLKHLADSGLMSAEQIAAFTAKLSPAQRQDVKQLAAELVRQDRLTK